MSGTGRYDNPKTVTKGKRAYRSMMPRWDRRQHSTVLSAEEEALAVAFRKHTSSMSLRFRRRSVQALRSVTDIAEVRTEEGKLHLFVAIDRTSKFAFAQLHKKANRKTATAFLKALIAVVPYKIHTVLTDNGIQFCDLPKNRLGPTARWTTHMFDLLCRANGIEHRLTKPNHPWTNGQVERMNRTLKEATVRRYHYDSHDQLRQHLAAFLDAYNFAKRLKTLKGLTPFESICKVWTNEPNRFKHEPIQLTSGLHT